jgi:hypothetical protein
MADDDVAWPERQGVARPELDSPWSKCIEARSRGVGLVCGPSRPSRQSRQSRQVKLRPAAECVPDSYGWSSIEEDARRMRSCPAELPLARPAPDSPWSRCIEARSRGVGLEGEPVSDDARRIRVRPSVTSGTVELPRAEDWIPDSYADESPWALHALHASLRPPTPPDAPDAPAPDAPAPDDLADNPTRLIPEKYVRAGVTSYSDFLRCIVARTPVPDDDDDSSWARCIRARRGGTPASADRDDRRSTPAPSTPVSPPTTAREP